MLQYLRMFTLDKHHKDYNFIIIKPNGQTGWSFRMQKWMVVTLFTTAITMVILGLLAIYFYTHASVELSNHKKLKKDYEKQQITLDTYTEELHNLHQTIEEIIENETYIEDVIENNRGRTKRKRKKKKASIKNEFKKITQKNTNKNTEIEEKITFLKKHLSQLAHKMEDHKITLQTKKERFAYTPSIPPVYGYVLSGYGMRRHPLTGKKRFHKGIDYPTWIGAPIKATADGIVEYASWSGTFGNVIVLNHNYGYRTVYAHCSKLLVERSETVKKGQVIAQVGTTGISTGPHLHYEVKRWRRSVNPKKFLNLDMFTASTQVW